MISQGRSGPGLRPVQGPSRMMFDSEVGVQSVQNEVNSETSPGDPGGNQGDRVGPRGQSRLVERDQVPAHLGMNSGADGQEGAGGNDAHGPIGLGGEELGRCSA